MRLVAQIERDGVGVGRSRQRRCPTRQPRLPAGQQLIGYEKVASYPTPHDARAHFESGLLLSDF
jgi:hypothetical protein